MIKQQTIIEIKRDDRMYQLYLSSDSQLGEVFDVLSEMRGFVYQKIQESMVLAKPVEESKHSEDLKPV